MFNPGGFGASGFKLTNLNLGSSKPKLTALHNLRTKKLSQSDGLLLTTKSRKTLFGCWCSTAEVECESFPSQIMFSPYQTNDQPNAWLLHFFLDFVFSSISECKFSAHTMSAIDSFINLPITRT